ncbi:MAG: TetR/AcrR family transcriptional regulator, partial [Rhodospirillaceae bacterium]|nr:TetR/AcrR family transcriptional regulator [Rhodospirillaceae bacterium]
MSKTPVRKRATPQKRPYEQRLRAEQAAETRQRIVEAALHLHGTVGPAQTTVSMVAAEAGVQRHTFYAHFPDETDLFLACSGLQQERDPLPDAESWRAVADPLQRLAKGLGALYDWYGRNATLLACVLRDAEHHALTRATVDLRIAPYLKAMAE